MKILKEIFKDERCVWGLEATYNEKTKVNPPKLKKGQLCFRCFKEIKGNWCWNGKFWHGKCKNKDTAKRIEDYLKETKLKDY